MDSRLFFFKYLRPIYDVFLATTSYIIHSKLFKSVKTETQEMVNGT